MSNHKNPLAYRFWGAMDKAALWMAHRTGYRFRAIKWLAEQTVARQWDAF